MRNKSQSRYVSASQRRHNRQSAFGVASIISSGVAFATLFGGGYAHDIGNGLAMVACFSAVPVATIAALAFLVIGAES